MNCLDFRRGALANPLQLDEPAREHAAACAACGAYLERQRELDAELFEALRVPTPDGFADRILLARGIRRPRRWPWALAASVALAAVLAAWQPWQRPGEALGYDAVAHLRHEPFALTATRPLAPEGLTAALAAQGMRLVEAVGDVTFDALCPVADHVARHLVLRMGGSPVTLLLLPDDDVRRGRAMVEKDGYTAITIPARKGSIAIVAASRELALAMASALQEA